MAEGSKGVERYDHIVFLSIDTLRSDCTGANPLKLWPDKYPSLSPPRTAILDEIVSRGCFFAQCVSAAPYTSASHASILNGRWPRRHGVFEFFNRSLSGQTVFTNARRGGRRTIFKTDFPLILGAMLGFDRGIDDFIIEDDASFLDALTAAPQSVSLAHFGGVHVPYGFHNLRYGGAAYRAKVAELEAELGHLEELPRDQLLETIRDAEDSNLLLRYKRIIQELWFRERSADIFQLYLDGITHFLENRFATFWEGLMRVLAGRRWLVILFGDHGEEYDSESFGHFNSVAEGVLRVPLLFLGSDVRPNIFLERVSTVDILPTIAALDGDRRLVFAADGMSLADSVRNGAPPPSHAAFAQAYVADTARFVSFQQNAMARAKKRGSLPHMLFKETVWDGDYKFSRTLADFSRYLGGMAPLDVPVERLERFDADRMPRLADDSAVARRMAALLDHYNAICA